MCTASNGDVEAVQSTSSSQQHEGIEGTGVDACKLPFKQRLQTAMEQSAVEPAVCINTDGSTSAKQKQQQQLMNAIKAEMALFSSSGKRGKCMQTAYSYLLTIPPTSVEAERAFSAAGIFHTKLRCRLSDKSTDTLCFLRAFYARRKQEQD